LVGNAEEGEPDVTGVASFAQTIPYEVLTRLSARLPAWYVKDGDVVPDDKPW
jgi:alanine racemase